MTCRPPFRLFPTGSALTGAKLHATKASALPPKARPPNSSFPRPAVTKKQSVHRLDTAVVVCVPLALHQRLCALFVFPGPNTKKDAQNLLSKEAIARIATKHCQRQVCACQPAVCSKVLALRIADWVLKNIESDLQNMFSLPPDRKNTFLSKVQA